jgi:predicted nucleic acid-binding protein
VILVDTSVWIDHLYGGDQALGALLSAGRILTHPFVIGELALGNLRQRHRVLSALQDLPAANVASRIELMAFIDRERPFGLGIGYVDAHLLAAVRLTPEASLWTRDKRLLDAAKRLSVAAHAAH